MSYFVLMGRRIPKQAITGFKFQNETDNICPFLSIRIRGKEEIIPFKDKSEWGAPDNEVFILKLGNRIN